MRRGVSKEISQSAVKGFTLIELAVVLVIVVILSVGLFSGINAQIQTTKLLESRTQTERIKQSLAQFIQINQFAPCPDTNGDGLESRAINQPTCLSSVGAVPFIDLGLTEAKIKDAWGNKIRYAVNRQATDSAFICDSDHSASYFCNQKVPAFNRELTPAIKGSIGAGNYTVCGESTNSCSAATSSENLLASGVSIVLVAYNQDGQATLLNCAAAQGASAQNCNMDGYYHQARISSKSDAFFDDYIVTLSGYEIKKWVFQ